MICGWKRLRYVHRISYCKWAYLFVDVIPFNESELYWLSWVHGILFDDFVSFCAISLAGMWMLMGDVDL